MEMAFPGWLLCVDVAHLDWASSVTVFLHDACQDFTKQKREPSLHCACIIPGGGVSLTQHMAAASTFPTQTSQPLWPPARLLHVPPLSSPPSTISPLIILRLYFWVLGGGSKIDLCYLTVDGCTVGNGDGCVCGVFFSLWLDASAQSCGMFS